MKIIFELVQVFVCILEAYLMIDFFSAFLQYRNVIYRKYTFPSLIAVTAISVYTVNLQDSPTVNVLAMQVIYISIILVFFQGKVYSKIFYYITATAIMMGSEFLFVILLSLHTNFSLNNVEMGQMGIVLPMLGIKLIALILFNVVKRVSQHSAGQMSFKVTLLYSIVPASLLGIMLSLAQLNIDLSTDGPIQIFLLVSCICAMLGNVVIFYVFERYAQSAWKIQQQEIQITKMNMEEKHYEQLEQVNHEHAAFLHDIRHYMKTIGEMASEDNNTGIVNILTELQIKVSEAESIQLCPNRLLNTILNEKRKEAEKKHISISIKVEPDCSMNQIEDMDLIAVVGNLMDNAIEAAEKCREGYIKVYLFNYNSSNISIMKIVNNYVGKIEIEDGHILTSKEDKTKHGLGIQNVCHILEKYNGFMQHFNDEQEYTAIAVIPNNVSD